MLGTIRRFGVFLVPAALGVTTACHKTATGLNEMYMDESKFDSRAHLRDMADNALLQEMSIADVHFVAHTGELSGTGVARLDRMAQMLEVYGGTVRYETFLTDDKMIKERLDNVREYLTMAGCNMDRIQVKTGMSGGRGRPADEAIRVHMRGTQPATTEKPAWAAGQSGQGSKETGSGSSQ